MLDISDDLTQTTYISSSSILDETSEELLEVEEAGGASEEELSVIAGGVREGWGPTSSVVLWRRMLGVLGNINKIKDPAIHAKVIECLTTIWDMLAKASLITPTDTFHTHYTFLSHKKIYHTLLYTSP